MFRKKITTDVDGKLIYPHRFSVGQMIKPRSYKGNKKEYGIIIEIKGNSLQIFWVSQGLYENYDGLTAYLLFEIVK